MRFNLQRYENPFKTQKKTSFSFEKWVELGSEMRPKTRHLHEKHLTKHYFSAFAK